LKPGSPSHIYVEAFN
jgi:hypothetical protein